MSTVVGTFPDRATTEQGITHLVANGIPNHRIGVLWRDDSVGEPEEVTVVGYEDHHDDVAAETGKGIAGGAVGGAATGAGAVLLASAGIALIPGIGALLAAGTAAAAAAAAAAGAVGGGVTGGIMGALIGATDNDASKREETREVYRDSLASAGFVVSVEADAEDVEDTELLLEEAGATDVSTLASDPARTV